MPAKQAQELRTLYRRHLVEPKVQMEQQFQASACSSWDRHDVSYAFADSQIANRVQACSV